MQRRATIADIARRAGVSIGTASNVISNRVQHSPETRDRVLQAAAELHFTPNALIRSLQSGKTHTIGVFCWRVAHARRGTIIPLFAGISNSLDAISYDMLMYARHPHEGGVPPNYFLDGRVDGLILVPGGVTTEELHVLEDAELPTVALYQHPVPESLGAITIDNIGGVVEAVDHLAGLGHRRIAFCSPSYTFDYAQRFEGYLHGLRKQGMAFDPALHIELPGDYTAVIPDLCDYLRSLPDPATAVIFGGDDMALAFLEAFARKGVRVPEQISLVGFDDTPEAVSLGLTTIHQPSEEIGGRAVEYVHRLINGHPAQECRALLPVKLIVRETTAPPYRTESFALADTRLVRRISS